jgi:transcriptional regulator with XRE-family HTH domain
MNRPRKPLSTRYKRIMKMFATNLQKSRRAAGYKSAEQFAGVLGLEPHAYRIYERGDAEPNFETLTRICELLNCDFSDLLPPPAVRDN